MKIVIVNKTINEQAREYISKNDLWVIRTLNDIQHLVGVAPNSNIEGIIMPDAHNNPEFLEIIKAIYEHKKNLCLKMAAAAQSIQQIPPTFHSDFRVIIEKHFGKVILQ